VENHTAAYKQHCKVHTEMYQQTLHPRKEMSSQSKQNTCQHQRAAVHLAKMLGIPKTYTKNRLQKNRKLKAHTCRNMKASKKTQKKEKKATLTPLV
jgi:hypothetical protein